MSSTLTCEEIIGGYSPSDTTETMSEQIAKLVKALKAPATKPPRFKASTIDFFKGKPLSMKQRKKWLPHSTKRPSPLRQQWSINDLVDFESPTPIRLKTFGSADDLSKCFRMEDRFADIREHIQPNRHCANSSERILRKYCQILTEEGAVVDKDGFPIVFDSLWDLDEEDSESGSDSDSDSDGRWPYQEMIKHSSEKEEAKKGVMGIDISDWTAGDARSPNPDSNTLREPGDVRNI